MFTKRVSSTIMVFFCFTIVLLSSISTTIFSESAFNDNTSISIAVLAAIGLALTTAKLIFDTIHNICNP
ncbi:hypothetical protein ACNAUY_07210 [Acinetobacter tibetensis]|uniref:Uncharacterized protein n=1 Tax=Acinetobacter tibetensis TaxID=2943497 RepID=A0AAE9LRW8_9GAMM|nr:MULTISPECIES: hypothetical protein [Acinetobacter]PWB14665.1 hypothetical protein DCO44_08840 [Acinetobacter sp. AM]USE83563.1 hypothetical protein M5E07_01550 [Acinetobacter tibetensis]HEX5381029.1 hypothetical protein [Acinetobacter sp.]